MVINKVGKVFLINVVENTFLDENKMQVQWYYANVVIDTVSIKMKVNSKLLDELLQFPQYTPIDIEYNIKLKELSDEGTKYEAVYEYVGLVPFNDINNKPASNKNEKKEKEGA